MRAIQRIVSAAAVTLLALPVAAQSESSMSEEMRKEIRQLIRQEVRAAVKDALADAKGAKTTTSKIAAKKKALAEKAAALKKHAVTLKKAKGRALEDALKNVEFGDGKVRVIDLDGAIDLGGGHAWMGEGEGIQVLIDALVETDDDDDDRKVFVLGDGVHGEWVGEGHEHAKEIIAKIHGSHGKWVSKDDDDDDDDHHGGWVSKVHFGDGKKFEFPGGKSWVTLNKTGDEGHAFRWVMGDDDDHESFEVKTGKDGNVFFTRKNGGDGAKGRVHFVHKGQHDDDHGHEEECTRHETFTFDSGEGHVIVRRSGDDENVDVKVISAEDIHKAHGKGKGKVISLDDVTNKAHGKGMVIKLDDVTKECCDATGECCDENGECLDEAGSKENAKAVIRVKKSKKKSILL